MCFMLFLSILFTFGKKLFTPTNEYSTIFTMNGHFYLNNCKTYQHHVNLKKRMVGCSIVLHTTCIKNNVLIIQKLVEHGNCIHCIFSDYTHNTSSQALTVSCCYSTSTKYITNNHWYYHFTNPLYIRDRTCKQVKNI